MTAVNAVCQPRHGLLQIATDAAAYFENGEVAGFDSKVVLIPEWSAAITGRGMVGAHELVAAEARRTFSGFSEMVAGIGTELPRIVEQWKLRHPFELILAGFSTKRNEPQAWFIRTPGGSTGPGYPAPYQIKRMPNVLIGPKPADDVATAAGFEMASENDEPEAVSKWLRKVLEVQRHSLVGDFHAVGGYGELTIIVPGKIEQRIVGTWPDHIGELIRPAPVAWPEWNAAHG